MRVALGHVQLKYETCRGGEYAAALKQIGHYAVWAEAVADRLAKPRERGYPNAAGLQAPRRLVEELLGKFGGGNRASGLCAPPTHQAGQLEGVTRNRQRRTSTGGARDETRRTQSEPEQRKPAALRNLKCRPVAGAVAEAGTPREIPASVQRLGHLIDSAAPAHATAVMAARQTKTLRPPSANALCPCGSGRKYKRCHGARVAVTHDGGATARVPVVTYLGIADKALAAGRLSEAQSAYLAVLDREPENPEALLGMALLAEGAGDDAASRHYHARLERAHPGNPRALFALGNFFAKRFDFASARARYRQAVERTPTLAGAWNNLGNVEKYLGNMGESIACYDRAVAADPENAGLHSAALISLYYDGSMPHEQLLARHVAWAERHAARFYPVDPSWPNAKDPERKLRLGYVSDWFDGRVLGHFLRNVIPHHDRGQYSTYAYSSTRQPDRYTAELRGAFEQWREIGALDDDAVAGRIREDAIDILIDLDGHLPGAHLLVFARKPAPVQVTWLGYWNTTGMRTVDYILTDSHATPEGSPQRFSEAPLHLPDTRICYAPVSYAPAVSALPCAERGVFSFGSFNRYDKIGPELLECWVEILRQVPESRLIIKNSAIAVPNARAELSRRFAERGIAAGRVELRPSSPHPAMLAEYGDVDLGLDTFPYNGGLTTCEALWQGVPIVAIEGERMISRQTSAMLRLVGAADFIARTRDEYVALAVRWAGHAQALGAVRRSLRERMRASALCDGPRFDRNLEAALRGAWRAYCASAG